MAVLSARLLAVHIDMFILPARPLCLAVTTAVFPGSQDPDLADFQKYENLDFKKLQFLILLRNRALRSLPAAPSHRASMLDFIPVRNYGHNLYKIMISYEKCLKSYIWG